MITLLRLLTGSFRWCEKCQVRTPHVKADGGWWVCGYCESYNE